MLKRRLRGVMGAVGALGLGGIIVAACADFTSGAGEPGGGDAGEASVGPSPDGGSPALDAAPADSAPASDAALADGSLDGGPDASCASWCACVVGADFCDDFEGPGAFDSKWWDAGRVQDPGSALATGAGQQSAHALSVAVPFQNTEMIDAALALELGTLANMRVAFDVMVTGGLASCTAGGSDFLVIGGDYSYAGSSVAQRLSFGLETGERLLRYSITSPFKRTSTTVDGGVLSAWTRVRFDVQSILVDGGQTVRETVSFAAAGSDDAADAPIAGTLDTPGALALPGYVGWLWLGLRGHIGSTTQPCSALIDNVAIYRQ